jgi:hypothetical protein
MVNTYHFQIRKAYFEELRNAGPILTTVITREEASAIGTNMKICVF